MDVDLPLPQPAIVGFGNRGRGIRWCNPSPLYDRARLRDAERREETAGTS